MSAYKHKLGFQKRKAKEVRETEASKGQMSPNKYIQLSYYKNSTAMSYMTGSQPSSYENMIESEY